MSSDSFRLKLAERWQQIVRTTPEQAFGPARASELLQRPQDRLAQPGYVGRDYAAGGLLFLGMNPGGGGTGGATPDDFRNYRLLEALRDATDAERIARFEAANQHAARWMPQWNLYRNGYGPILSASGIDVQQVAVINLVKWRTAAEPSLALKTRSWSNETGDQLALLAPTFVVVLGSGLADWMRREHPRPWVLESFQRSRGDLRVTAQGQADIERIGLRLRVWRRGS